MTDIIQQGIIGSAHNEYNPKDYSSKTSTNTSDKPLFITIEEKIYPFNEAWNKYVFHGGCLTCVNQKEKGLKYCRGCRYYPTNSILSPDLSKG